MGTDMLFACTDRVEKEHKVDDDGVPFHHARVYLARELCGVVHCERGHIQIFGKLERVLQQGTQRHICIRNHPRLAQNCLRGAYACNHQERLPKGGRDMHVMLRQPTAPPLSSVRE